MEQADLMGKPLGMRMFSHGCYVFQKIVTFGREITRGIWFLKHIIILGGSFNLDPVNLLEKAFNFCIRIIKRPHTICLRWRVETPVTYLSVFFTCYKMSQGHGFHVVLIVSTQPKTSPNRPPVPRPWRIVNGVLLRNGLRSYMPDVLRRLQRVHQDDCPNMYHVLYDYIL